MASRQSNSADASKKSPQLTQNNSEKLGSKNASIEKVTSQVNAMSVDQAVGQQPQQSTLPKQPSPKQSSPKKSSPKQSKKSESPKIQKQQKQQGSGSPSTSAKGLKKAGSVGSMSDAHSSASELKIPKDFKKGKRASVADVPMREESSASFAGPSFSIGGASATEELTDEDAAALEWFIDEEYLKEFDKESKPEDKQHRRELADKLKMEGNDIYKNGEYAEAARAYTAALRTLPLSYGNERAILYSNRAACFLYMDEKDEGILDCSKALEINPNYLKAILRRAQLYEKMEKLEDSLTDYKKVLELEPRDPKALEACARLPDEIRERNDKLKTEMIGKLKDLGNMILKPFGLSTDNFKVQQDPSSGSYSINLQQNK